MYDVKMYRLNTTLKMYVIRKLCILKGYNYLVIVYQLICEHNKVAYIRIRPH